MNSVWQRVKELIPAPVKTSINRVLPESVQRWRKERWEFEWQRDSWAELYRRPEVKAKAKEYWRKFRHLDEIVERTGMTDSTRVLDVGCGISTVLDFVPGDRVGIDPLAERYRSIYPYGEDIDVRVGYGEEIPFPDDSFDVVFCSNSIDHHEHPETTIAEMARVLAHGGNMVVTVETFEDDLGSRNAGHPHSITPDKLLDMVADLELVEHWDSPWYGLRGYALGDGPEEDSREQILLLAKP